MSRESAATGPVASRPYMPGYDDYVILAHKMRVVVKVAHLNAV